MNLEIFIAGPAAVIALTAALRKQWKAIDGLWTVLVAALLGQVVALSYNWYTGAELLKAVPLGMLLTGVAVGGDAWVQKITAGKPSQ